MSITFSCEGTVYEDYKPYPEDEPDYVSQRPVAPWLEINLSNGNAFDVMRVLRPGVEPDHCGYWGLDVCAQLLAQATQLLHSGAGGMLLCEPTTREGNHFFMGRDADYVKQRLTQFSMLFALAIQKQSPITWG